MTTNAFMDVISAEPADRADLFLRTSRRLGAPLINIAKDFWVCWTLNTLYHRLPKSGPRLLFKGGTSLSKAYGLINRFSEDIDVTVFRDDLGHPGSTAEIAALSNKKRKATLDAIAADCSRYITTDLLTAVSDALVHDSSRLHGARAVHCKERAHRNGSRPYPLRGSPNPWQPVERSLWQVS